MSNPTDLPASSSSAAADDDNATPILTQRLVRAGASANDISFRKDINDNINTRQDGENSNEEVKHDDNTEHTPNVVEIKTLVWEVTCSSSSYSQQQSASDPFYVVTALKIDDKVDIRQLKKLVEQHCSASASLLSDLFASDLSIRMAPLLVAEERTGYPSGCMPPICHTIDSLLFVDESILNKHNPISISNDDNGSLTAAAAAAATFVSIGSGIPGQSLVLPEQQFLQAAESTSTKFSIGSFVQQSTDDDDDDDNISNLVVLSPHERRQAQKQERKGWQHKPLDRLNEYRRFQNRDDKAKLFKSTARRKGGFEDVQLLVEEAVKNGEFQDMMTTLPQETLDKNALHMAAWRGDMESVQLLLETAKEVCPELDVVNIISKGHGNYGKTALFYALTQCREDVVRYLLDDHGASLLFVNNKGQTPCSIAVSHLNETICEELYRREAEQLRAPASTGFADYRKSHSDKLFYGDLDPRFPLDNDNFGGDLEAPLQEFQKSVEQADPSTIIDGLPTVFLPRSVRPTMRWWNRTGASLQAANQGEADGQLTFTQPRIAKEKNGPALRQQKQQQSKKEAAVSSSASDELPNVLADMHKFEQLELDYVLDGGSADSQMAVLVNCSDSIQQLEQEIDATIGHLSEKEATHGQSTDAVLLNSTWGLDCEWKPGVDRGKDSPVATLQLSTRRRSFLIDVQSLCQPTCNMKGATSVEPTILEQQLCTTLSKLFQHSEMPLLGFGIMQDLGKLAASFPHLPCFSNYQSVMDLQGISNTVYPRASRSLLSSLQKMVAVLLNKRMDKSEQCSDWVCRPLSESQMTYASLDAAVLPILLHAIAEKSTIVGRCNGQFFSVYSNLQSDLRYTFLDDATQKNEPLPVSQDYDGEPQWIVPMGSVRQTLARAVARQCWPSTQATPAGPTRQIAGAIRMTKKEKAHVAKVGPKGTIKPKPVQLKALSGNLDNLPIPGITLGYTKDSCAFRVVGHIFMNTLPERTHVGFNRRSGVVETSNAWIIFCNFGGSLPKNIQMGRQSSEFTQNGRYLSFQVNPTRQNGKSSEKTLMDYILSKEQDAADEDSKALLLFAREGSSSKYMYCGACRCTDYSGQPNDAVDLVLELQDFEALVGDDKVSSSFVDLVQRRKEMYECLDGP